MLDKKQFTGLGGFYNIQFGCWAGARGGFFLFCLLYVLKEERMS
jgi:hypothetical protein